MVHRSFKAMAVRFSRELPSVEVPGPGLNAPKRSVRMITHGGSNDNDSWRAGYMLDHKTYFSFWSFGDKDRKETMPLHVQRHGVGYLDPDDVEGVDAFLGDKFKDLPQVVHHIP
ncbi:hypothetical protein [Sporisorium scitamineum]|nr:hypothetical protein [Sporisorium scitamineum]